MQYDVMERREKLTYSLRVGDNWVPQVATFYETGDSAGNTASVTTGTGFLAIDPERSTFGTCSSAGSTLSIVDTSRTEADDFWIGVKVTLRDLTTNKEYTSRVNDFTSSTNTLAVDGFPVAPAANDVYWLNGYPLKVFTAAGTSGNNGTISYTSADLTAYAGRREVHYKAVHSATQSDWYEYEVDVLP